MFQEIAKTAARGTKPQKMIQATRTPFAHVPEKKNKEKKIKVIWDFV